MRPVVVFIVVVVRLMLMAATNIQPLQQEEPIYNSLKFKTQMENEFYEDSKRRPVKYS